MSDIKINKTEKIDLDRLIDSRLLIQANSGGGKSWLIRRLLEQSHGKVQQIILDPEGEFSSLREKFDYILAGKGGDTPAEPKSAAMLAKKLLELNVSAIIDLYELHPQDRKKFVRLFLEAMVNAPKELWHPCLVVIDEAHTFVPEKGESEAANAVIGLASLGRKRGFGAILATQRISKLHKDAAAECNNKLIGRTSLDIDRKRAGEELGFTSKEDVLSLRTLKPGEFYAFGPAISDEVIKTTVGEVQTSHPKAGARILTKTVPPTDKIKKVLAKLADLPQEAEKEAQTICELKAEIRALRMHRCPKVSSQEDIDRAVTVALTANDRKWQKDFDLKISEYESFIKNASRIFSDHGQAFYKFNNAWTVLRTMTPEPKLGVRGDFTPNDFGPKIAKSEPVVSKPVQKLPEVVRSSSESQEKRDGLKVSSSQQRILNALAWAESLNISPCDKTQVALLADQRPTSGGYFNNLGLLRSAQLITYPNPGMVSLTDTGRTMADTSGTPTTTEELHDQLFRKLPSSQVKILKALIEIYPEPIGKNELATRSDQRETSGGYFNNLGRLRSLKLIDYPSPGMVVAEKVLFIQNYAAG